MTNHLSVLMPARNEERTVKRSASSVLFQLRKEDELIVYDDASTDETLQKLMEIRDPRLKVIEGKNQIGTSAAANLLNQAATNSLVAKLDADDYALPGRFAYQRKQMEMKGLDFHFGCSLLKRGAVILPQPPKKLLSEQIAARLPFDNPLTNSTMMAKKEIIDELGGYPQGSRQDYSLWLRAALSTKRMERSHRYLTMREIPPVKKLSEARNRPIAPQIDKERVQLFHSLGLWHKFDLSPESSFDEVLSRLNSQPVHRFRVIASISRIFS